jgi:hypothetical protein
MGEKTRAEGTIANTARERKRDWAKNAGKMLFFISACGNHGYFSGFSWMPAVRKEHRDIRDLWFVAEGGDRGERTCGCGVGCRVDSAVKRKTAG